MNFSPQMSLPIPRFQPLHIQKNRRFNEKHLAKQVKKMMIIGSEIGNEIHSFSAPVRSLDLTGKTKLLEITVFSKLQIQYIYL